MNILVIGGTHFIGPPVVCYLYEMGHHVTVFHRGQTSTNLPETVQTIKGDRTHLERFQETFEQLAPDVVLDMIPFTEHDAQQVVQTFQGIAQRVVAVSSQDVYRAYDVIRGLEEVVDPVPLTEDSPLRSRLYPFENVLERPIHLPTEYEKILVERVYLNEPDLPATILRLPMVYGPGDPLRRLYPYVQRMDAKRPAIVLEENLAHWRGSYGYVENVAWAIAVAVTDDRAIGRIYNVADPDAPAEADRIQAIAQVAKWHGEVMIVPRSQMPESWSLTVNPAQNWWTDTTRIRKELDYREPISQDKALRRTLAWERSHPPENISQWAAPTLLESAIEDEILSTFFGGRV